jgi:hypothetical protein
MRFTCWEPCKAGSGRWPEALANFDRVLALKADFPEALANRSVAPERLGRLVEAADSLDNLRGSRTRPVALASAALQFPDVTNA